MLDRVLHHLPDGIKQKEIFTDNIKFKIFQCELSKVTNKKNGALYGSPTKSRRVQQCLIIFIYQERIKTIGIVGAMLGGIAVANTQILRRN